MYRKLRGLMAEHVVTVEKLANILNLSCTSVSKKLNGHVEWSLGEAWKILEYFRGLGVSISLEELFFSRTSNIVEN